MSQTIEVRGIEEAAQRHAELVEELYKALAVTVKNIARSLEPLAKALVSIEMKNPEKEIVRILAVWAKKQRNYRSYSRMYARRGERMKTKRS